MQGNSMQLRVNMWLPEPFQSASYAFLSSDLCFRWLGILCMCCPQKSFVYAKDRKSKGATADSRHPDLTVLVLVSWQSLQLTSTPTVCMTIKMQLPRTHPRF